MKGYNTIEELSLQQSYEILQNEESNPYIEQIRLHYEQELEKWHADEKRDFYACKSMREYEQFIAQYQKYTSFYTMQYKKAALDKIETLFWNANSSSIKKCSQYLEKYPRGKYANDARMRIQSIKRKRTIKLIIVLIILAFICIIAYQPAGDIYVSRESVSFSKYGGAEEISITTKADESNIYAFSHADWIKEGISGHDLRILAEENPDSNRYATVTIKAYSTFLGERISSVTKYISIQQESGLPTFLNVTKKSLSFDKHGKPENSSKFIVKTDGVGCSITCPADYVHIEKNITSKSHSPREIEVDVTVDKNDSVYRTATISIRSGQYTETVNLSQESGAANFLNIDKHIIRPEKEGTGDGYCYRVTISTDGASWSATTSYSWISLNQHDKKLDITVTPNDGDVRTGYVYVKSNNGHQCEITVKQDGNPSEFYASRSSWKFDTNGGSKSFDIINNSQKEVNCSTNKTWLNAQISGNNVRIHCKEVNNQYTSPREGIVILRCGDKEYEITINQQGYVDCKYCDKGKVSCDNNIGWVWEYENFDYFGHGINGKLIHGTCGWQSMFPYYWSRRCKKCNGTGKIDCSHCGGTGKMKSY